MKALVLKQHGGLENLEVVTDHPMPQADEGHVVIRVRASSFNYHDVFTVKGMPGIKVPLPVVIGLDMAGEITEIGAGVDGWSVGDRVLVNPLNKAKGLMGEMLDGGMAEYCRVSADQLILMPPDVTFEEAASLPVAYGTAHRMLVTHNTVKAGDKVLVLGASGGVGTGCVMLAKHLGAEVIACARGAERLEIARQAGADHLLDSQTQDIREVCLGLGGLDVVYDAVGGEQWTAAFRACRFGARLLPIGFASGEVPQIPANHLLVKNLTAIGFWVGAYKTHAPQVLSGSLAQLFAWWREGKLNPHVSNVLPLEEAEAGLDLLRTRAATGKVVVRIG